MHCMVPIFLKFRRYISVYTLYIFSEHMWATPGRWLDLASASFDLTLIKIFFDDRVTILPPNYDTLRVPVLV